MQVLWICPSLGHFEKSGISWHQISRNAAHVGRDHCEKRVIVGDWGHILIQELTALTECGPKSHGLLEVILKVSPPTP